MEGFFMSLTSGILVAASLLYVAGGVAMKFSNGLSRLIPTLLVFVLFGVAAALQTWAMKEAELGTGYSFVLGLEAILAVVAGHFLFGETITVVKGVGALFVVLGIALLKI